MSRAPPFPTRRARSPSQTNGSTTQAATRPLQISRPPSRSTTPSNNTASSSYTRGPPMPMPNGPGPSRPQRSELRGRGSEASESGAGGSRDLYRDSVSTTRSDGSVYRPPRQPPPMLSNIPSGSKQPTKSPVSEDDLTSPSLNSAIAAFQSAGARKRAMTNGSEDMDYQREKQQEYEAEMQRQRRIREKTPGRQPTKPRAGDIDAILDQVKDGWEFVVDPDFNTVDLALQLLDDDSAIGKDMESFRRTKNMLSKALKGSVDKHYKEFADSLPHHSSIMNHLNASQSQVKEARVALQEAKEALGNKRTDLVQLWSRGQTLEEMMRLLDQIEHLKSVPDLLETLISEKRLLQASVLLLRSLKLINKPDMQEIGAVSDLRSYLVSQETALRDILVDELHSHLYLKSFWCESRWGTYSPNQDNLPTVEFEEDRDAAQDPQAVPGSPTSPSSRPSRLTRFLNDLSLRPNDPPLDLDEPNFRNSQKMSSLSNFSSSGASSLPNNPEVDSFAYMETLLESLAVLRQLGSALDTVAQRLPTELFGMVETTLDEASERADYGRRMSSMIMPGTRSTGVYVLAADGASIGFDVPVGPQALVMNPSALRLAALESSAKQVDHETLKDFFWTLYSKLNALAQGLRVIFEVSNRIGSRRDFKDSSGAKPGALFPLSDVWMPVQAEVRTLISDYITDEEQGTASGRNPISSINEVLREGKFNREKIKPVFRFVDTDLKYTTKTLKGHEEDLMGMLKDTVPGLVQGSAETSLQTTLSSVGSDDRLLGAGQRHRLLVRPDAFHVTVLFRPTLCFLERVADILPFGTESARASSVVLDEFVLKVYLPQLEEKVSTLFHEAISGPEAFQPDPFAKRLSPEPLVKASTQLLALINSLCAMLQTSPFHRENYSRLILGVIIQFYQRCSDRYQDLVSTSASKEPGLEANLAFAAQWAQRTELTPCLNELLDTPETDRSKQNQLCRQEINLELDFLGQATVTSADLVPSLRHLAGLCCLYRSVSWFSTALLALKAKTDGSPLSPTNLEPISAMTPFTPYLPVMPIIAQGEALKLPLTKEMSLRFQALLKTYEQLAEVVLHTIRIDVRCRVMHYLDLSMRNGNYQLDREATEPDANISDLNTELVQCEDIVSVHLPKKEQQFVFAGLGVLMEHLLVINGRHLRLANAFGIKKIMRNMLALQQNVKTIMHDPKVVEFERAKQYYSLYFMSPPEMLESIRKKTVFSFDEYQTMLNLQCGVVQSEREVGAAQPADRNYSMYVIELHGLEMGSEP
ncbi:hypothetical protein HGRIS_008128 [Hohenbuehelia grisea]|uniref:Exocyst complex component Sec8 n=1 Tax=Hohenbuehelia grisea TaxID=104357 RepID=A0ABR3J711_9AGAR